MTTTARCTAGQEGKGMFAGWEPWIDVVGVTLLGLWAIRWALSQEVNR